MARVSDGTNVPISPAPASASNLDSPNGSILDLEGVGGHPTSTMEENSKSCLPKDLLPLRSIGFHSQACTGDSADLKTVSCLLHNQWASITNNISDIEPSVDGLAARVAALEAGAASAVKRFWLGKIVECSWTL